MAAVTVKFYSLWRQYLGKDSISLEADTMEDALAQVDAKFGANFREKLEKRGLPSDGKLQDYSVVLLNGTSCRDFKQTTLKDGDILHLFPPIAGG